MLLLALSTSVFSRTLSFETQFEPLSETLFESDTLFHQADPGLPRLASARSAIVIDRASGRVLGAKDPDRRLQMASTTKMMTALLVIEYIRDGILDMNDIVTIFGICRKHG